MLERQLSDVESLPSTASLPEVAGDPDQKAVGRAAAGRGEDAARSPEAALHGRASGHQER